MDIWSFHSVALRKPGRKADHRKAVMAIRRTHRYAHARLVS